MEAGCAHGNRRPKGAVWGDGEQLASISAPRAMSSAPAVLPFWTNSFIRELDKDAGNDGGGTAMHAIEQPRLDHAEASRSQPLPKCQAVPIDVSCEVPVERIPFELTEPCLAALIPVEPACRCGDRTPNSVGRSSWSGS